MRHRNEKMKEGNCMIEIEKPQIECIEDSANSSYGKYVVEPLERGYGITLGNALRRIMLSSLPGTAATAIKIAGVQHEFSTIPGVKEDVTEIVLNVKSLITKLHNAEGTKTVYHRGHRSLRGQGRRHQVRQRGRGPQSRPAHRNARRRSDAQHGADAQPRPRLCPR